MMHDHGQQRSGPGGVLCNKSIRMLLSIEASIALGLRLKQASMHLTFNKMQTTVDPPEVICSELMTKMRHIEYSAT